MAMFIPFTGLTLYAIYSVGFWGIIEYQLQHPAGWQVLADLVIACVLLISLIIPDAKRKGRKLWPYIVITVFLASIGPLLYLILAKRTQP